MSINVNVSGNPIRINRGKLVTAADLDYDKKEFDNRRRIRLEQVRHQSKDIAENVRNKVRKEQKKQLSDFERREEQKLKQWQNRKLLELQQQYRESLKDIGSGHAQAAVETTNDITAAEHDEELKGKAKSRGHKARQKLQADRNAETLKKAIPVQQKKLSRDVENARSSMVARSKKTPSKKRKKKAKTNINITTNVTGSSASESGIEELDLLSDNSDLPTVSDITGSGARRKRSKSKSPTSTSYRCSPSPPPQRIFMKADVHQIRRGSPKRHKSPAQTVPDSSSDMSHYLQDTRISDRILSRRFLVNENPVQGSFNKNIAVTEDVFKQSKPHRYVTSEKRVEKSTSANIPEKVPSPVIICQCKCRCYDHKDKETNTQNEIPMKPTVSLKDVTKTKDPEKSDNKVQYYDHKNRFSKEIVAPKGSVKKIPEENIDVCCHLCQCQEKKIQEKQYKNDRDAEIRGRKALEKTSVHKDYKQMLKQLPVLQKQERLATMTGDKPIFHMDNDRLQEHERKKQNRMENQYERHFPKTITIPPKKHVVEEDPFNVIDMTTSASGTSKTPKWDEDKISENGFTLTKDCGNIVIETDVGTSNKEDYLKFLLDRLKLQKEMLLREAANLPQNSNLNNIISGLDNLRSEQRDNGINISDTVGNTLQREEGVCPLPESTSMDATEKKAMKHKRIREQILSTSSSSSSSTPTKRRKHRKYRIVLQNTSTQTSPKTIVSDTRTSNDDIQSTTKDKELSTKRSPKKKSSTSSARSENSSKSKKSRSKSPKDKASSPIQLELEKKPSTEFHKCKCTALRGIPKPCDSKSGSAEDKNGVCEIVIKIQENDAPEIKIRSPKKQTKDVIVKATGDKVAAERSRTDDDVTNKERPKRLVKINEKTSGDKISKGSWRDQLSRSDARATSTSTSYFSPPDYSKSDFSRGPTAQSTETRKSYISSDTTENTSQPRRKIDPRLLMYIKKLLTMSRRSIDDLGVSSVSEVSTPSVTLTSYDSKYNSLNQLRSVIKYFNLNPQELAHYLSYSEDTEGTSTSLSAKTPSTVHSSDYEANKSQINNNTANTKPQSSLSGATKTRTGAKSTPPPLTAQRTASPTAHYSELANLCEKRIAELTAMIDQVRMEKQQILSPVHSDKENTTQYMGLPLDTDEKSPNVTAGNTSSDLEQAEINKKMLEVDYSLAEQLKIKVKPKKSSEIDEEEMTELDRELLERYRKLVNMQEKISEDDGTATREMVMKTIELDADKLQIRDDTTPEPPMDMPTPFTSILLDIPRLPKLITSVENTSSVEKIKRPPPPAKGLMAAKKFNDDITTVPHELSTIVEVDSQMSTRIRSSYSPKARTSTSPIKNFDDFNPIAVLPQIPTDWTESRNPAEEKEKSDGSMPDIVAEIGTNTEETLKRNKGVQIQNEPQVFPSTSTKDVIIGDHKDLGKRNRDQSTDSSTDKSEIENIESMLKSMGMGWAISTLRKTKAAFDIPSSSSSSSTLTRTGAKDKSSSSYEDNQKQSANISNTSDVTLRDMLGRKIFCTSSTSDSLTQTPSMNLTKALTDLSAIQGSAGSSGNKNQRTSTPIRTTKSSESKEGAVTGGESELSSVKISDEFLTMPDTTANNSAS